MNDLKSEKNDIITFEKGSVEILFCNSSHELPLHSHESWCIGMVYEGEVTFEINQVTNSLKRGMLFLIPSNTGVRIIPVKKYKYVTVCIKDELRDAFFKLAFDQYFMNMNEPDDFFKICYDFMWKKNEKKLVSDIISILTPLLCVDSLRQKQQISAPVEKAISYMKLHVYEKFDLEKIAEEAFISKYHLVRLFKKEMGVSPHQYYIQTKLRIAKADYLADKSESEIAAELNFSDQSHLCRQFKQLMGVSLQDYKKNIRK